MDKEQFARFATQLITAMTNFPDEVWHTCYPAVALTLNGEEIYLGIREKPKSED